MLYSIKNKQSCNVAILNSCVKVAGLMKVHTASVWLQILAVSNVYCYIIILQNIRFVYVDALSETWALVSSNAKT